MKRVFWIGCWLLAIVSLSQAIQAGKTWRAAMSAGFVVETVVWVALLLAAVAMLTLRSYAIERRRGNVVHRVGLFERILERGVVSE